MIRKAKLTELSSVMQIWLDGNIEAHPFIPVEYWQHNAENVRQTMMNAEIYIYQNEDSQKVVGFIGLINHFIAGLFVHSKYRTCGIGKELIDYVKLHKAYLVSNVYKKNLYALKFYQQERFNISKEIINHDTGEEEYVLTWEK